MGDAPEFLAIKHFKIHITITANWQRIVCRSIVELDELIIIHDIGMSAHVDRENTTRSLSGVSLI